MRLIGLTLRKGRLCDRRLKGDGLNVVGRGRIALHPGSASKLRGKLRSRHPGPFSQATDRPGQVSA